MTYIESADGSYHSYTFPVIREIVTDSLENLLLSLQKDGSYSAFLVSYGTTAQEKLDIEDGKPVDLSNRIKFTAMDDHELIADILSDKNLNTTISSKEACGWSITTSCYCNNPEHPIGEEANGMPCPCWQMVIENNICIPSSGGPVSDPDTSDPVVINGSPNNGNNNGGTGPPNNTNENPDVTTPTPVCTRNCPIDINDSQNCDELKKLTSNPPPNTTNPFTINGSPDDPTGNNTNIRSAIVNMGNDITSNNFEQGFGFF